MAVRPQGTGFTNINKYLEASKNNRLGSSIKQGITSQAQGYQNVLQGAKGDFQSQLGQEKEKFGQQKQQASGVLEEAKSLQGGQKLDEQKQKQFGSFTSGAYTGPQGLQGSDFIQSKAQSAEQLGRATQSQGGRENLLQRFAAKNQYTGGQQKLDSLLLGQTGGQDLQQARKQTYGLGQQAQAETNIARGIAGQENVAQQRGRQGLLTEASTGAQSIEDQVKARYEQLAKESPEKFARVQNILKQNNIDQVNQEVLDVLGLGGDTRIYNLNLADIATAGLRGPENLNIPGVASQEQFARARALAQLAGRDLTGSNLLSAQESQVGTFKDVTADQARVNQLIENARKAYEDSLNQRLVGVTSRFGTGTLQGLRLQEEAQRRGQEAMTSNTYNSYNNFLDWFNSQSQRIENEGSLAQQLGKSGGGAWGGFTYEPSGLERINPYLANLYANRQREQEYKFSAKDAEELANRFRQKIAESPTTDWGALQDYLRASEAGLNKFYSEAGRDRTLANLKNRQIVGQAQVLSPQEVMDKQAMTGTDVIGPGLTKYFT